MVRILYRYRCTYGRVGQPEDDSDPFVYKSFKERRAVQCDQYSALLQNILYNYRFETVLVRNESLYGPSRHSGLRREFEGRLVGVSIEHSSVGPFDPCPFGARCSLIMLYWFHFKTSLMLLAVILRIRPWSCSKAICTRLWIAAARRYLEGEIWWLAAEKEVDA